MCLGTDSLLAGLQAVEKRRHAGGQDVMLLHLDDQSLLTTINTSITNIHIYIAKHSIQIARAAIESLSHNRPGPITEDLEDSAAAPVRLLPRWGLSGWSRSHAFDFQDIGI